MQVSHSKEIANFHIVGINYKKTDAAIRGLFAINPTQYQQLLARAKSDELNDLFVLSTCNRTEVYGFASHPDQLIELLSKETIGERSHLDEIAYIKSGEEAIRHLYQVGTGLDSQILGDYEIIGQIRSAAKFAKSHNSLGGFLERLVNSVSQVSKLIKTETGLSKGTVSVAFATVRMIEKICPDIKHKKIVLVGVGKIGRNTCKNMIEYLGVKEITLINRTLQVAADFAEENGLRYAPYEQLSEELAKADVILVASNAPHPTVLPAHFTTSAPKVVIDLSIPFNVDPAVKELPHVTMVNVDELSKVQDETLQNRLGEVPKALSIIEEHMEEFLYWHKMRKHAVVLKAVKDKLQEIHTREILQQKNGDHYNLEDIELVSSRIIQKMINLMAGKVRKEAEKSDQYIAMINDIFETGVNQD
ncbi:glutamyl-tRNA reductase [Chitinophaga terrae (ex Kim and Jung 2007)]|uniref:Glutamyl-tRNA reductase n=1 Tax=Chitinophaga terrae (ex Kim and Jung 2007) TaxID=408074 RepID=A0A1H4C011_9BACT|nr:glutamyl-tRNA reductase [Chitinophaga terrae (ex Kim and Jung 2007)]MDQ0108578.1 glutamyl-tRNA reductase [Chitinophaga terrae (ex Kim and Jung 2007)]GEP91952.1 glutamyl-tRNA reductase [Chitinophaga terrae (ex Kim and Jung 2007)]SEA53785.1 glutamyl-tRNA reductase [Chitinophaga terrae (ex Kim and Jung 2007)]